MKTNHEAGRQNGAQKLATVCVERCQKLMAHIERTKARLVAEFKHKFNVQERLLQLALNEAEALAWETEYPHLVFPTLALEKVRSAANWHERQGLVRRAERIFAFGA